MKNWKTFLFGAILAAGTVAKPIVEKRPPTIEELLTIGGAIGLGNVSKDKDVTGVGENARRSKEK